MVDTCNYYKYRRIKFAIIYLDEVSRAHIPETYTLR